MSALGTFVERICCAHSWQVNPDPLLVGMMGLEGEFFELCDVRNCEATCIRGKDGMIDDYALLGKRELRQRGVQV